MNLWVRLPEPLDAAELLPRAERENVTYLPGRYFAVTRHEPGSLRLSFAGLAPGQDPGGAGHSGRDLFERAGAGRAPRGATTRLRRWFETLGGTQCTMDDTFRVKVGLAEMLKGGVIMDVTNAEQALIAENGRRRAR